MQRTRKRKRFERTGQEGSGKPRHVRRKATTAQTDGRTDGDKRQVDKTTDRQQVAQTGRVNSQTDVEQTLWTGRQFDEITER